MKTSVIAFFATFSCAALARSPAIGEVSYAGTGCPAGTANITLDPDTLEISVQPLVLVAEAGALGNGRIDRKSCSLAIPVDVPRGRRVVVEELRVSGAHDLTGGAEASLSAEAFIAGSTGPRYTRSFREAGHGHFDLIATPEVKTDCGEDAIIRLNSSVAVIAAANDGEDDGTLSSGRIQVGHADLQTPLKLRLRVERCWR